MLKSLFKPISAKLDKPVEPDNNFNTNVPIRLGVYVLLLGFGGALLWAAFAPLDEGVPSQGAVSIDTKRKVVQHQTGGIIQTINVREGQQVRSGDVLLTLNDSAVRARLEEVRQHYLGLRATEGRLLAEQNNTASIKFHPDLLKSSSDPLVLQHIRNQEMLLASRRNSLQAELQGIEEAIRGQQALIQGYKGVLESRKSQRDLLGQQLASIRELVNEGFAPKTQQIDMELRLAQVVGDVADKESGIIKSISTISELRQRAISLKQQYRKEIETQMSQVIAEVDADAQKLNALVEELARTEIRSPVDGQVVGLQFQTLGAVIQPGQKILDVVPLDEGLLLEARIAPHLIDRVRTGQTADIRFANFANSPQLAVEGKVDSISKDLLTDPNMNPTQPGASYYLARVSITSAGMEKLGNRHLQPGMPALIVIKTGERTLLTYLLHPFTKRIASSFKEE